MNCAVSKRDEGSPLALGGQSSHHADRANEHASHYRATYTMHLAIGYPGLRTFEGTEDYWVTEGLNLPDKTCRCNYTDALVKLPVCGSFPDSFLILTVHGHDFSILVMACSSSWGDQALMVIPARDASQM
jgi:hypothetical protein